jgi:starch phosphorylase
LIQKFTVVPRIPERLKPLQTIANNLWWSWSRNAVALFRRIDMELWERCGNNPKGLLAALHPNRLRSLEEDDAFIAHMDQVHAELEQYCTRPTWYSRVTSGQVDLRVAYFSAEFGIHECLPIYSGGLGGLAGDHVKSADELGIPFVAVGLAYQQGYYRQYLNSDGWQQERYPDNDFYNLPMSLVRDDSGREVTIHVDLPHRRVHVRIWQVNVGRVPLYLLDCNLGVNEPHDREITARLYGGDLDMRIRQEIVLGIGGIRALERIGYRPTVCHMNEGHSAFLGVERIRTLVRDAGLSFDEAREATCVGSVFTTHTPVPAGNDRFPPELVVEYFRDYVRDLGISVDRFLGLGRERPDDPRESFCMTVLALRLASFANGVSELHGKISRHMWRQVWPGVTETEIPISHVTNGVHTHTWLSDEFGRLFERYMGPQWLDDPLNRGIWQRIAGVPDNELWRAKERLRDRLVAFVRMRLRRQLVRQGAPAARIAAADEVLDPDVLTIGFARRFATYKRAYLILKDLARLKKTILDRDRPVQIIMAGKAHPHDHPGKEIIRQIAQLARDEEFQHRIVFIEDYDMEVARYLMHGADIWLNTPRRPLEASGTSGMKAALNGTLNLSVLDGWWPEAFSGDNGWAIGTGEELEDHTYQDEMESRTLYDLLENEVVPLFYSRGPDGVPRDWVSRMKNCLQTICPQFNTNRMVSEYAERFYLPAALNATRYRRTNWEIPRELCSWKQRVRDAWKDVSVRAVQADIAHEVELGSDLEIRARVTLGNLSPGDILVEVRHGIVDSGGQIVQAEAVPLRFSRVDGDSAIYEGAIPCRSAGRHGFSVRVLPHRDELVGKFDAGLVTWWQGNLIAVPELVPERVG